MKITTEIKKEWVKVEELIDHNLTADMSTFYKDLDILDKESTKKAHKHFQPWFGILELGILWMSAFYLFLQKKLEEEKTGENLSILLLLAGASCTHVVSIRRLCLSGLDSSARVVLRSLMETTQYFLVMLTHPEIRKNYKKLGEIEDVEFNHSYKFWRNYLSREKTNKVLKKMENELLSNEEEFVKDFYKELREYNYTWASQFVHVSPVAAFVSPISISVDDDLVYPCIIGGKPDKLSVPTLYVTNETIFYFLYFIQQLIFFDKYKCIDLGEPDMKNDTDIVAYWGPEVFRQVFGRHLRKKDKYMDRAFKELDQEFNNSILE